MRSFLIKSSVLSIATFATLVRGCQSSKVDLSANEGGSTPVSEDEAVQYKKALLRCYKSGGSRVVKMMGELRCF